MIHNAILKCSVKLSSYHEPNSEEIMFLIEHGTDEGARNIKRS